jgi:two-component system response regulator AtoC
VIQIALPPLRVREGDVPLLAEAFLASLPRFNEEPVRFSAEALEILTRYRWPGNVRELRNVVERAAALAEGALIGPEHLPAPLRALPPLAFKGSGADYKSAKRHMIRSFERHYLVELLHRHHGHMSRAAREAGVDRKTIERMVKKHGLRVRREPA